MQSSRAPLGYFPGRAAFAKLICLATIGLIFAGSVVTSKDAGLSVPDWPTSFGYQMWTMPFAMWKGGVLYEHFHRVFASIAGSLVLVMAVWLLWKESRRRIRLVGLACLAVVILQGILGGVTVLLTLPTAVSVCHGVLAQLFFCLTIVLAYGLSRERVARVQQGAPPADAYLRRGVVIVFALVAAQLLLAAWMRHDLKHQGGVAIPDFPKTAGQWLPWVSADSVKWVNAWREQAVWNHGANFELSRPVQRYQLVMHLAHRVLALLLVVAFTWLTIAIRRRSAPGDRVRRTMYGLDALLLAQATLGVLVVWSSKGALITSLHVMTGAAILGTTMLLALRVFPAGWAEAAAPALAVTEGKPLPSPVLAASMKRVAE